MSDNERFAPSANALCLHRMQLGNCNVKIRCNAGNQSAQLLGGIQVQNEDEVGASIEK